MKTFKLLLITILTLLFTGEAAYSADNCSVPVANAHTFSTSSDQYLEAATLAANAHKKYYFNITTAGTLTITVASSGSKVHVAYSDTACPTAVATNPVTTTVTVTSATDINVDLYAELERPYTITVTFQPSPLVITKTNTPLQMPINTPTNVLYSLLVKNYNTAEPLSNIRVTDTLPAGVTITNRDSNISAAGWDCSASSAPSTIDCTLSGSLNPNQSKEINVSAVASSATVQNIINTAHVSATGGGSWSASDTSTLAAVSGAGTVDLEMQKFASSDFIPPNTDFMYLMFVVNYDNTEAQLVRVTDTFPADSNVSFISAGGNGWSCTTPTTTNRTFVCDYDQPLGKGITYFLVNAHTTGPNNTFNVRNTATVSALNTINHNHSVTDYADINISTEGSSGSSFFTGYYPKGGSIEVSDKAMSNGTNRTNAQIWTKVAATQNTTFPVYFVNPTTGAVMDYNGTSQNVPLTVIFKLTDETCSAINETYLSYDSSKSVIAEFDNGYGPVVYAKTAPDTTFDLRNIAKKNSRLLMKYIDIQGRLDTSGESCSNSNLSSNIKGLPQCIANSTGGSLDNNKYINVFGIEAFVRCAIGNGKPCDAVNHGQSAVAPYNTEYGCYECTIGGSGYCSKDNFAIRPKQFDLNVSNGAILKAKAFNFAFKGLTNNTTTENTLDYNETQNSTFAVDVNISDSSRKCQEMNLSISPNVAFHDGLHLDSFRFSNIGDVNLTIHDINGSEFGKVDENDTNPTVSRFITPYGVSFQIIPDHFKIDGNISNGSNGFTYFSNFEEYNTTESRNISASLDLNVSAVSDQNITMTNYSARNHTNDRCYAKDGNFAMNLASALSPTPIGALNKFLWYDVNHVDHNGSLALNQSTYIFPIKADQYDKNDTNGTAQVNYVFNFDRNQTKVVNPLNMTVNTLDVDDSDLVHGSKVLNSIISYRYGRLIARDIRVFGSVPFSANGWYEVYNTPIIGVTALPSSKNDSVWHTNFMHDDNNDGDGNITVISPSLPNNTTFPIGSDMPLVPNAGTEIYQFNAIGLNNIPYNGKAHINTDPWLWFGINASPYVDPVTGNTEAACLTHPCFNINVVPAVGATGSAKSTNEGTKGSKKSDKGGTGWHSTTDYAPAIR